MPEIAEVHLNTDHILKPFLLRKQLIEVKLVSGKLSRNHPTGYTNFSQTLPQLITFIGNRGKFTYMKCSNGWSIGIQLGMTGRFTLDDTIKYNHLELIICDDDNININKTTTIFYNDPRNFGNWYFWSPNSLELDHRLNKLGIDFLLEQDLSLDEVVKLFRTKNHWNITKALMSQEILAGVGNWIKAESLYMTQINPYALISNLSDQNIFDLYRSCVYWARYAYMDLSQGFSDGMKYSIFQEKMKIYRKDKCPLGYNVIHDQNTSDRRTTHWVKEVQVLGLEKSTTNKSESTSTSQSLLNYSSSTANRIKLNKVNKINKIKLPLHLKLKNIDR